MSTYEQMVMRAQGNILLGAVADAMALDGEGDLAVEQVALVFTAVTPERDVIGVLSYEGHRTSLGELATVGLLQMGSDAMLRSAGSSRDADQEDPE